MEPRLPDWPFSGQISQIEPFLYPFGQQENYQPTKSTLAFFWPFSNPLGWQKIHLLAKSIFAHFRHFSVTDLEWTQVSFSYNDCKFQAR